MALYSLFQGEVERVVITLGLAFAVSCGVPRSNAMMPPVEALAPTGPSFSTETPRVATAALVLEQGEAFPLASLLSGLDQAQRGRWATSQPAVASVDPQSGHLSARSSGTAVVTLSETASATPLARVAITVQTARLVREITIAPSSLALAPGERRRLIGTVRMASGELHGDVVWSSSDTTRAVVNATTGEVTAIGEGRVTVRAAYRLNPRHVGLAELTIRTPAPSAATAPAAPAAPARPAATSRPQASPPPAPTLPQNRPPARPAKWW